MSAISLAEKIDLLVAETGTVVSETEDAVIVSNLIARDADELNVHCRGLGWTFQVFDSSNEAYEGHTPHDDFGPFRLVIQKPAALPDTLQLLTNVGFDKWLQRGHPAPRWHVARLGGAIRTQARLLEPWGHAGMLELSPPTKSPRSLVREYGAERRVTEDVRPWLAQPTDEALFVTPTVQVWARASAAALLLSLADEIDAIDGSVKFRGPPRLTLPALPASWDLPNSLGQTQFAALQGASCWVFENERDAEMRHILLATELARCSAVVLDTTAFLREHMASAWESAQIAYQMALAGTSRDTLKILTELRKAITDETIKLSDLTRQLMAAVAGALAIGIGLIAFRVAASAPTLLIRSVMLVVVVYVLMVIISGWQFISLQRQLRNQWQPRLYRFLPIDDYTKMVTIPISRAEKSFIWTAVLGGIAVLVLAVAGFWPTFDPVKTTSVPAAPAALAAPSQDDNARRQVQPTSPMPTEIEKSESIKQDPITGADRGGGGN